MEDTEDVKENLPWDATENSNIRKVMKDRSFIPLVLLLSFFILGSLSSHDLFAANYFVSPTGSDNHAGTIEQPFKTIQHGIDTMQPGDTLYLRGGTYNEHSIRLWGKQGSETAWFSVRSYPGEWAVIDAGHPENPTVNIFESSSHNSYAPRYWRFSYFEVTGAGPPADGRSYEDIQSLSGAGFHFWPGFHMEFDHLYVHDNYGGGGPNGGSGIKFQNEGGTAAHHIKITHCYLKDNGWPGSNNQNLTNIVFFSDYVGDPAAVDKENALNSNEVAYNLIEGSAVGFKHKNSQMLMRDHSGTDMEAKERGDKIHHNIFRKNGTGILALQDFAQISHNIVDSCPSGILVGQPPTSSDREPFHVVVNNNHVINSASGGGITSYHGLGGSGGSTSYTTEPWHPYWYVWNNVLENGEDGNGRNDLNILFAWSEHTVDMNTVTVDNNYFVPRSSTDKVINIVDARNDYSIEEYMNAGWASSLYAKMAEPTNPLRPENSPYKLLLSHRLSGSTTISNGGVGIAHPYLEATSIPAYMGPCGDQQCSWVDEVLELQKLGTTNLEEPNAPRRLFIQSD